MSDEPQRRNKGGNYMNAGEAVYHALRVYGRVGSMVDGPTGLFLDRLNNIRSSCPTPAHRPPPLSESEVERIVAALTAVGIVTSTDSTWDIAAAPNWWETKLEWHDRCLTFARLVGGFIGVNESEEAPAALSEHEETE